MRMTLLEIVQNILSAADGEEVTSISDTVESAQCAMEVENAYYELIANEKVPVHCSLIKFEALVAPTDHPNVIRCKDAVDGFKWIKYNIQTTSDPKYVPVKRLTTEEFMERVLSNSSGTLVKDVTTDLPYYIPSDKHPEYYTMFDDEHLVFDSYNSSVDTTIQESKLMGWGQTYPTFTQSDSFTPDLLDRDWETNTKCSSSNIV